MSLWKYRIKFEQVKCAVARRMGLDINLLNSAHSIEELHPGETVTGPPCIFLPRQLDRVIDGPFGLNIREEVAQVQGAPRSVEGTIRYVLNDVYIGNGAIYGHSREKLFNTELPYESSDCPRSEHERVVLRSSLVGSYFFGHWLRDDCATHLLAEQIAAPRSMPTPAWPDRHEYLTLFSQSYQEIRNAFVRQLILFQDIGQNANKAARFRALRTRVWEGEITNASGALVYLKRGTSGTKRRLINEPQIIEALARAGVLIVEAEQQEVTQLIEMLSRARIVISVEGSQISHALYSLHEKGALLVIQPPDRFFNSHMDWARALNIKYGLVVGQPAQDGFYLPLDDLLRTIDLVVSNCG